MRLDSGLKTAERRVATTTADLGRASAIMESSRSLGFTPLIGRHAIWAGGSGESAHCSGAGGKCKVLTMLT
jgi:hypothetical protein